MASRMQCSLLSLGISFIGFGFAKARGLGGQPYQTEGPGPWEGLLAYQAGQGLWASRLGSHFLPGPLLLPQAVLDAFAGPRASSSG